MRLNTNAILLAIVCTLAACAKAPAPSPAPVAVPKEPVAPVTAPPATPTETLPLSEARVDGTYVASQMMLPIKASCEEGPCGGSIKMSRAGQVPLKSADGVYKASASDKSGVPGPAAYSETTISLTLKPIHAEWIDGRWIADTLLVKRTISVVIPSFKIYGTSVKGTKSATSDTMRAFVQPDSGYAASLSPSPSAT